jgi:molybdate-binding protein
LGNKCSGVVKSKDAPFDEAARNKRDAGICEAQEDNNVQYAAPIVRRDCCPSVVVEGWIRHSGVKINGSNTFGESVMDISPRY